MRIRLELGSQNANPRKYKKLLRLNKRDSERKTGRKKQKYSAKQHDPIPGVRKYK